MCCGRNSLARRSRPGRPLRAHGLVGGRRRESIRLWALVVHSWSGVTGRREPL